MMRLTALISAALILLKFNEMLSLIAYFDDDVRNRLPFDWTSTQWRYAIVLQ